MSFPLIIEHFAVGVSALTGVLAARGRGLDLFGVLVLAVVTAFGGGTVRDLLVGDTPVVWLRQPSYLYAALGVGLVGFFAFRTRQHRALLLDVADAFALALFNVIGARKGFAFGFNAGVAIMLGVITGVAGGIVRDVLIGRLPLVFRRDTYFYATAAAVGGGVYALLLHIPGWDTGIAESCGIVACLLLRLGALKFRLVLPGFDAVKEEEDAADC